MLGLLAGCGLVLSSAGAAQGDNTADWRFEFDAGLVNQFETSLERGGDFDLSNYFVRFNATRAWGAQWRVGFALGYGEEDYGFQGTSPLGFAEPWEKIHLLRLSVPVTYRSEKWTLIAIPSLRYSGESDAAMEDAQQLGVLAGSAYRFNENLSIGPGFGVFSDIEDGTDFFPILLLNWKLAENLSLQTGRGLGASRGPGLFLNWSPIKSWRLSLGARYEKLRFRLDETGVVPNGVGQNRAFPLSLGITYQPDPDIELSLLGGMVYQGELQLEDSQGERLAESDYAETGFAGLIFRIKL
jgi:hypothetical protein